MRNPHLPSINGYSKHKDVPKNEALTSFSEISSAPVITTAYVGKCPKVLADLVLLHKCFSLDSWAKAQKMA